MNTNLIDLLVFYCARVDGVEVIISKATNGKGVVKVTSCERVDGEDVVCAEVGAGGDLLLGDAVLAIDIRLPNKPSQPTLNLPLRIFLLIHIMRLQQRIRLHLNLPKPPILRYNRTLGILLIPFPIIELHNEILLVNLLQPRPLNLIHTHIHSNEAFVDWSNVIETLLLEEVNAADDLASDLRGEDGDDLALGL